MDCDSCDSYWKAEGEDPPCEGCAINDRMERIARIMAWKFLLEHQQDQYHKILQKH